MICKKCKKRASSSSLNNKNTWIEFYREHGIYLCKKCRKEIILEKLRGMIK